MACCVLIGGLIGLAIAAKASIFRRAADGHGDALRWRLHKECDDGKE